MYRACAEDRSQHEHAFECRNIRVAVQFIDQPRRAGSLRGKDDEMPHAVFPDVTGAGAPIDAR